MSELPSDEDLDEIVNHPKTGTKTRAAIEALRAKVERLKAESSITHEALRLSCTHSVLAQYVEQGNTIEALRAKLEAIEALVEAAISSRPHRRTDATPVWADTILAILHHTGDTDE